MEQMGHIMVSIVEVEKRAQRAVMTSEEDVLMGSWGGSQ